MIFTVDKKFTWQGTITPKTESVMRMFGLDAATYIDLDSIKLSSRRAVIDCMTAIFSTP